MKTIDDTVEKRDCKRFYELYLKNHENPKKRWYWQRCYMARKGMTKKQFEKLRKSHAFEFNMSRCELMQHYIMSYLKGHQDSDIIALQYHLPKAKRLVESVFGISVSCGIASYDYEELRTHLLDLFVKQAVELTQESVSVAYPGSYMEHDAVYTERNTPFKREDNQFRLTKKGLARLVKERSEHEYLTKLGRRFERL